MSEWRELFNGTDLRGWTARGEHAWRVAEAVRLNADDPKLFEIQPGSRIMVNGDTGRTLDIHTVAEHGSCELRLEYCVSQGSNSGVYLQGQYEIQILDSYGTPDSEVTYATNGGIYGRWIAETRTSYDGAAPRVNASRAPGEWQELHVRFYAPQFDADGHQTARACFDQVTLNGVVIHEGFECSGPTRGAWNDADIATGPLRLQGDHGPVAFRNVRMRALE